MLIFKAESWILTTSSRLERGKKRERIKLRNADCALIVLNCSSNMHEHEVVQHGRRDGASGIELNLWLPKHEDVKKLSIHTHSHSYIWGQFQSLLSGCSPRLL